MMMMQGTLLLMLMHLKMQPRAKVGGVRNAECLVQLVKHWSTVQEVKGSNPRSDQHSGSLMK